MKPVKFIVEKTITGYSAYAKDDKYPLTTVGDTIDELKANILDALNSFREFNGLPEAGNEDIAVQIDLTQFFDYYKEINAKALAKRVGMNETLLSQYVNGIKEPSSRQTEKILSGIKSLGKELSSLEFN
ncbi:MAG: hypothetical protein ABI359_10085 [Ginsengibacter sp.]